MSRPSATANRAPIKTRGIALAALMSGPSTSESSGLRPSATPKMMPRIEPAMKPPTVSSMVTRTWSHKGPRSVPCVIQIQSFAAIAVGCDQKKTSIQPSRVVSSHVPRKTTPTSRRRPATVSRRRCASRRRPAARSASGRSAGSVSAFMRTLSRAAALLTFIAHKDFVLEVLPDLFVDLGEMWLESNFGDVAGPRKIDFVVALDRPGSGCDHKDAVAQPDRFLECMGHEHDRCRAGCPQGQELVLHQCARLYVEGAERPVPERAARSVDPALRQGSPLAHTPPEPSS